MDRWLEAFGKWTPMSQMIFSLFFMAVGLVFMVLFGLWVLQIARCITVWRRTIRAEKPLDKLLEKAGTNGVHRPAPLPVTGWDFEQEVKSLREEETRQAKVQDELRQHLDEASAATK